MLSVSPASWSLTGQSVPRANRRWWARGAGEIYLARDDARTIQAGPGRFGRRAERVEQAQARRDETARRWGDDQPPGAQWPDNAVRSNAARSADRIVNTGVRHHTAEGDREEQTAAGLDRQVTSRDRDQEAARATNERNVPKREAVIASTERDRARIDHNRQVRAELAETMTPSK